MKDHSKEKRIVVYTIDTNNNIISFEKGCKNAAIIVGTRSLLQKDLTIGSNIYDFMPDQDTKDYYNSVFYYCRTKQTTLTNEYRCDLPSHQRYMKVTLTPSPNGDIRLEHQTLNEIAFAHKIDINNTLEIELNKSQKYQKRCSVCNRLQNQENLQWIEPTTLVSDENLDLHVTHTVCKDCRISIDDKLYKPETQNINLNKYTRSLSWIILGVVMFFSLTFYMIYKNEYNWQKEKITEASSLILNNINIHFQNEISQRTSDLLQLSDTRNLFMIMEDKEQYENILELILDFMQYKPIYNQLRLIDMQGEEKFRINHGTTHPLTVPTDKLQVKKNRYYIQEALKLGKHEVYISQIDLNMEDQKVEIPYKPTMRLLTKIYDNSGQEKGLLVLNLNFEKFFNEILSVNMNSMNQPYLADDLGRWLLAPKKEISWLFMFEEVSNQIEHYSKQLWEAMKSKNDGHIESEESLITYKMLNLLKEDKKAKGVTQKRDLLHLWLIHEVSNTYLEQKTWENISKGLPYLILGTIILLVLSIYLVYLYRKMHDTNLSLRLVETSFENSDDGLVIIDNKMKILRVNAKYELITGFSSEELIGNSPKMLASGWTKEYTYQNMWDYIEKESHWEGEVINRRKDAELYHQLLRIVALKDKKGETTHYLGVIQDITDLKKTQERIQNLAFKDTLTGLPNRQLLMDRSEHALANAQRYKYSIALVFIDLDDFKIINDSAGHIIGDKVLVNVAERLKMVLRDSDTIARIGGDEFVVLLEKVDYEVVLHTIERLLESFNKSINIEQQKYFLSGSIGAALYPEDANDIATLFSHADTAMYTAKNAGKNRYSFFVPKMNEDVTRQHQIMQRIQNAIKTKGFSLVYQPQISLEEHEVIGAEVLLRWNDEELGFVSPAEFIPIAESSGLIVPITKWIIEHVCIAIETIRTQEAAFKIAINISSSHVKDVNFVQSIHTVVTSFDISPRQIELEITEGTLIDDIEDTIEKIELLKSYGYRIAIDDFGTGYSSLSYVKKLGFEKLKIDQSFIKDLPEDKEDASLTKSIIAMGKALGMKIIAEGAETKESVAFLQENGCDMIQGYYFSKPLPLEEFLEYTYKFNNPEL